MEHRHEAAAILAVSTIVSLVPALLTGSLFAAVQFALAFTALIVMPVLPWVLQLELSLLQKFALTVILGLSGIPTIFFVIGVLGGPLNLLTFIGVPLVVLIAGLVVLRRKSISRHVQTPVDDGKSTVS